MSKVDTIPVQVDRGHGNVQPILFEVLHALDRLLADNSPTTIDLAGLPFGPGELDTLQSRLGRGELEARLDSLGRSLIYETTFPGVWWIEHRNVNDEIVGRYLEVTGLPDILSSQPADMKAGRSRLEEQLR